MCNHKEVFHPDLGQKVSIWIEELDKSMTKKTITPDVTKIFESKLLNLLI